MPQKHLWLFLLANTVFAAAVGAGTYAFLSRAPFSAPPPERSATSMAAAEKPTKESPKPAVESEPDSTPCREDLRKFCKAGDLRSQGPMGCLGGRIAELSPACATVVKQSQSGLASKCGAEMERYCKNVQMGAGRMLRCLRENTHRLGSDCKQKIDQI